MTMVYQKGTVYLQGTREKKWYGKFRVYRRDRDGREAEKTRKVVLGLKSELRKWEAERKLQEIILKENGNGNVAHLVSGDDTVTFGWFVAERYLPMRRGQWRPAWAPLPRRAPRGWRRRKPAPRRPTDHRGRDRRRGPGDWRTTPG